MNQKAQRNIRFPAGVSDFQELVKGNFLFADKTLFVKDIMDDGAKVIVVARPRRFGKTLNLSMLYYFLEYSKDKNLFNELSISKDKSFCKEHQSQYPVVFISFKDVKKSSYQAAYSHIVELMRRLYEDHRYLIEDDALSEGEKSTFMAMLNKSAEPTDVEAAIKYLLVYITRKFNKNPILLIDEYDTPIQESYLHGYYEEMVGAMRSILGQALKDNSSITKAVITDITSVSQENLFSGLNNVVVYSFFRERYAEYFGFTESEVTKMLLESGQKVSLAAIKEWYNGYQIGENVLYNPWSIINCLANDGKLQPYWVNTPSNNLIGKLVSNAGLGVKRQFEDLLQGNVIEQPLSENLVFTDIERRDESLWSLLLYAGYLKLLSSELHGTRVMCKISIPNKEISFVYDRMVEQWFDTTIGLSSYDRFVQSLKSGEVDKFKMYLSSYIMQAGSYFDFNSNTPEQIFHVFILGFTVGLRDHYYINSNRESGLGRCDVMFIPKDKASSGILLEFKVSDKPEALLDKAAEALRQIKDKQYIEAFKEHSVAEALAIGIAFCGKKVELTHETIVIAN